jgi:hypothetical protein
MTPKKKTYDDYLKEAIDEYREWWSIEAIEKREKIRKEKEEKRLIEQKEQPINSKEKQKAIELVDKFRILLMNEDTECGNEILCTSIAKKSSLIVVKELMNYSHDHFMASYWSEVSIEIQKL